MLPIVLAAGLAVIFVSGLRRIPDDRKGILLSRGKTIQPGLTWILPGIQRLKLVAAGPFEVSLPPQSAITKDEVPVQLQVSLAARLKEAPRAALVKDWRV